MTGKEIVNLIRKLREKGMASDEIIEIIEFIETHEPREDGIVQKASKNKKQQ